MKTENQLKVLEISNQYIETEISKLPSLVHKFLQICEGIEPLNGTGNTHGDNLEIRAYAEFVAGQIRHILYNSPISLQRRYELKEFVYKELAVSGKPTYRIII